MPVHPCDGPTRNRVGVATGHPACPRTRRLRRASSLGNGDLPRLGPILPQVRATFGYEWFRSALSDNDVTSGRSYRGPLLTGLQASANLGSDAKCFGLFAGVSTGIFSDRALDTPAFSSSSYVDAAKIHALLDLGIRAQFAF